MIGNPVIDIYKKASDSEVQIFLHFLCNTHPDMVCATLRKVNKEVFCKKVYELLYKAKKGIDAGL